MGRHSKNNKNVKNFKNDNQKSNELHINNKKKRKKEKKPKKKSKFKRFMFFVILIAIIIFIVTSAISMYKWQSIAKQMISNTNSTIVDSNNTIIATLGNEKIHKNISITEIPNNLQNAYIAIEDERFYKHHGVDMKRTVSAIASYIIHFGSSSFGGSTITQQLVKNLTGNDESSISRKVSEWNKAVGLELCLSKEQILETYLNIIYVGPNIYGVEMGSDYYFSKNCKDLTLEECAFLAGINNSPNSYNPFTDADRSERINKRTKLVLSKMLELNYISDEEYNNAISNVDKGLNFKKGNTSLSNNAIYSYHSDSVISQAINDIAKKKKIDTTFSANYLNMAGLTIYSTQDSNIQKNIEKEFEKDKYILKSKKDSSITSQSAMVIIDHHTRTSCCLCTVVLVKKIL